MQCRSQYRVKGGGGSEKMSKIGKKRGGMGKERKNREKEEKSGRFFHFAPPDRAGYATA